MKELPPPLPSPPALCPEPKLVVEVMEEETRRPIGGAIVTISTEHPETLSIIRSVTLETRVTGLVEDQRFIQEEIRINVQADRFGSQSRQLMFTCERGGCLNCVWTETFLLGRLPSNQTLCPNVGAHVLFLDETTEEPVPFVVFDVFEMPISCPLPNANLTATTNQTDDKTKPTTTTTASPAITTPPTPVFILDQLTNDTSLFDLRSRSLKTQNCTPLLTSSGLRGSQKGSAKFSVKSPASYLLVPHPRPDYPNSKPKAGRFNCSLACEDCRLQLSIQLVKPSCPNAVLNIHVRGKEEDKPLAGASVIVYLGDTRFTEEPLITNNRGEVSLEVKDRAKYSVVVYADGFESLQIDEEIVCDLRNCSDCSSVLAFDLPMLVANETISCPDNNSATLSVSVLDELTKLPPVNLSISLTYLPLGACSAMSSMMAYKTPHVHSFWRKKQVLDSKNDSGNAVSIKECRDLCKKHIDCFFFTLENPNFCWTKNSIALPVEEWRNRTDPSFCPWTSIAPSSAFCSPSDPCEHGQGFCSNDAECAEDLVCGRSNCPTPGHSAGDRCCQTHHGLRPGLLLANNVPSLHRPVNDPFN